MVTVCDPPIFTQISLSKRQGNSAVWFLPSQSQRSSEEK